MAFDPNKPLFSAVPLMTVPVEPYAPSDAELRGGKIVHIEPGQSDLARAEEIRAQMMDKLSAITDLMTEAKRHGLTINFSIGPPDAFGRVSVAMLEISKKLA